MGACLVYSLALNIEAVCSKNVSELSLNYTVYFIAIAGRISDPTFVTRFINGGKLVMFSSFL
jgi:hypothetical protein